MSSNPTSPDPDDRRSKAEAEHHELNDNDLITLRRTCEEAALQRVVLESPQSRNEAMYFSAAGSIHGLNEFLIRKGHDELVVDEIDAVLPLLSDEELKRLKSQLLAEDAKRNTSWLPDKEAYLLEIINDPFPGADKSRLDELMTKRDSESLTEDEEKELLQRGEAMQEFDQSRLEALMKLANLRGVTLMELRDQLQL